VAATRRRAARFPGAKGFSGYWGGAGDMSEMTISGNQRQQVDFRWLANDFAARVPGVAHAVVVSADGLLLAASRRLPTDRADQIAAAASGVVSLTQGAARCFQAGEVKETVVEMDYGIMVLMGISDGSCLVAMAAPNCDVGQVAFEMALLVERVGQALTPELRATLHGSGPVPAGEPIAWPR
jgi:predicted regulator of Ras-like GTPase activity (Roadblock/LC7/MglB family)